MQQVVAVAEQAAILALAVLMGMLVGLVTLVVPAALLVQTEGAVRMALMAGPVMGAIAVLAIARFESTRARTGRGQS